MKRFSLILFMFIVLGSFLSCDKICTEDGNVVLCETTRKLTSDTLVKGKKLLLKQFLMSENGLYRFKLYKIGNLVISDTVTKDKVWESHTKNSGANNLKILKNGKLALRGGGKTVWKTDTEGSGADRLTINNDGSLVLYADDIEVWSVNKDPNPPSTGPKVDFVGIDNYNNIADSDKDIVIENMPAGTNIGDVVGMIIINEINDIPSGPEPMGDWVLVKSIEESGAKIDGYYKIILPSPEPPLDGRETFTIKGSQKLLVFLVTFRGIAGL